MTTLQPPKHKVIKSLKWVVYGIKPAVSQCKKVN